MRKTCFNLIYELAKKDDRIVYIGSDVGAGTLDKMKKELPKQFFMEGIQEQHLVGMTTGLALSGKIVYLNTIATFITRRCYEQVLLDTALHNANVRLLGNGGGLVYAPLGPTHLATDDIALMKVVPNMTILCPADADEMTRLMPQTVTHKGPIYIRFGKDGSPPISQGPSEIGKAILMKEGERALVITTGMPLAIAMQVHDVSVLHCHTVKPLDHKVIIDCALPFDKVVVVEEHLKSGGLGSDVAELLSGYRHVIRIGVPDKFVDRYGTYEELLSYYGISKEGIENAIRTR